MFLRTLIEYSEEKITKDDVVDIVTGTVGFMVKFWQYVIVTVKMQLLCFQELWMKYTRKNSSKDDVVMALASEYLNKGITAEN